MHPILHGWSQFAHLYGWSRKGIQQTAWLPTDSKERGRCYSFVWDCWKQFSFFQLTWLLGAACHHHWAPCRSGGSHSLSQVPYMSWISPCFVHLPATLALSHPHTTAGQQGEFLGDSGKAFHALKSLISSYFQTNYRGCCTAEVCLILTSLPYMQKFLKIKLFLP